MAQGPINLIKSNLYHSWLDDLRKNWIIFQRISIVSYHDVITVPLWQQTGHIWSVLSVTRYREEVEKNNKCSTFRVIESKAYISLYSIILNICNIAKKKSYLFLTFDSPCAGALYSLVEQNVVDYKHTIKSESKE